ncbi:MAG: tRNA-(ms[2]io[6]A)-hydroxylase [Pseudomonadota bacterium]|nr:tRNA-(ms[2]io[6]A)-hydroxylase [Pseudomonadota bacterium]
MSVQLSYELFAVTTPLWTATVLADFDSFLIDHAACERKASSMAMSMLLHYSDKPTLVQAMTELAVEELLHFKAVMTHINARQLILRPDEKDPYVNQLRTTIRTHSAHYLLDRLLVASIIEKRGAERFGLVANALTPGKLQEFYRNITDSESRHFILFLELATEYFDSASITTRLHELLEVEAKIIENLPLRAALH